MSTSIPSPSHGVHLPERLHPQSRDDASRAKALAVASQFEQVFVRSMVQDLRKTAEFGGDDEGMFGSGPGSDTYSDWFDQNLAEHISSSGQVGISQVLMREFEATHQVPKAPPQPRRLTGLDAMLGKGGIDVGA